MASQAAKIYKPIAMEGEGGLGSLTTLNWQTLGWCEGKPLLLPGPRGTISSPTTFSSVHFNHTLLYHTPLITHCYNTYITHF